MSNQRKVDLGWIQFTCTIFSAATDTEKGHLLEWGCLLNKGAYLVGASFNRNIWRGPHIREGALIGRRALNRIITVLHRFTENILGVMYFKLIFWFICTTLTCRTFLIHLYTLGVLCLRLLPQFMINNSHVWPRENFSLQYHYNIKQTSDEN